MMISPRRTFSTHLLVDAARAAGAEVREGCSLVNLVKERDRISGVRLQDRGKRRLRTGSLRLWSSEPTESTPRSPELVWRSRASPVAASDVRLLHLLGWLARQRWRDLFRHRLRG